MRTKVTIIGLVLGCAAAAVGIFVVASLWLGWIGFGVCSGSALLMFAGYIKLVRPWHSRWGATDIEVVRAMPGDEIILNAASTTRAISIRRPRESVWPWLVQIGYGRGGWYSYDWIDNDGKQSAHEIIPAFQSLRPGDRIEMLPEFGPRVVELTRPSHILAGDAESGTWCLAAYPEEGGCRLVSRWRQSWKPNGLASKFFVSIADPGAFLMEQRMLRGIKQRAESVVKNHELVSERS